MTKLGKTSKKALGFVRDYNYVQERYGSLTLLDVYQKPSIFKVRAYEYCLKEMSNTKGFGGTITTYNSQTFTFIYQYYDEHECVVKMVVKTAWNDYEITL